MAEAARARNADDAVILGELRFRHSGFTEGQKAQRLEQWFAAGIQRLQCLPWDGETGLRWAELLASLRASGKTNADQR